ncbi:MAG: hypothetical protein WC178_02740 [Candidatus Paceibacterota bacterium]
MPITINVIRAIFSFSFFQKVKSENKELNNILKALLIKDMGIVRKRVDMERIVPKRLYVGSLSIITSKRGRDSASVRKIVNSIFGFVGLKMFFNAFCIVSCIMIILLY